MKEFIKEWWTIMKYTSAALLMIAGGVSIGYFLVIGLAEIIIKLNLGQFESLTIIIIFLLLFLTALFALINISQRRKLSDE